MLDWTLALIGIGVGIAVCLPVGPANLLCIQRSVRQGFWAGLSVGLGGLLADAIFAAAAAFGITAISSFIEGHLRILKLVGGIFLIAFGIVSAIKRPRPPKSEVPSGTSTLALVTAAASSFAVTIANPGILFAFVGILGGLGRFGPAPGNFTQTAILWVGIVIGGLIWWVFLASVMSAFRNRITVGWLKAINVTSGVMLGLFGAGILLDLVIGSN